MSDISVTFYVEVGDEKKSRMSRKFENSKYLFNNYNTRRKVTWVKRFCRISHLGFLMIFSGARNHHGVVITARIVDVNKKSSVWINLVGHSVVLPPSFLMI